MTHPVLKESTPTPLLEKWAKGAFTRMVWILLIANQVVAPSYVMDLATVVTSRYLLFKGEGPDFEVLSGSEGQGFVVGWVVRWTAHPLCRRSLYPMSTRTPVFILTFKNTRPAYVGGNYLPNTRTVVS